MKVIKNVVLFLFLLFVCDRALGLLLQYFYNRQVGGLESANTTYVLTKAKDDIVIFGSSRATHHYIPSILEDSLHKTCYNAGRVGRFILFDDALLAGTVKRYKPHLVILDISDNEFDTKMASQKQKDIVVSSLLPYINNNAIYASVKTLNSKQIILANIFHSYKYNSEVLSVFKRFLKPVKSVSRGYEPLPGTVLPPDLTRPIDTESYSEDSSLKNAFVDFCKTCEENKIKLLVIVSPSYEKIVNNSKEAIRNICSNYNSTFMDFTDDTEFLKEQLYYDTRHLNSTGAILFSERLASKMKDIY
ncbi:MAG TPA: hypothetical protein VN721_04980 [Flavipsychrobacter sp.]|nr:hypothetical protein [Flavipsychrobacter sp.]